MVASPAPASAFQRFLAVVERVGNALPQPATLFALLGLGVILLSALFAQAGVQVVNPASGQIVQAVSLMNVAGVQRIITQTLANFINFPPLGVVIVCLLGVAVSEATGLIRSVVRLLVLTSPRALVTPMVVFAGVMSNVGGDVGYVVLIPLSAAIFHTLGRHPLAGLAAAFAGVSGGFSANLLVSTIDVLLGGLTQSAAAIIRPDYIVTGLANYYFLFAATFLITGLGTWVTHRFVEPRLGKYAGGAQAEPLVPMTADEKRGLWWALIFAVVGTGIVLAGLLPESGFLRDPKQTTDPILRSYFISNLVPFIFIAGRGPRTGVWLGRTHHPVGWRGREGHGSLDGDIGVVPRAGIFRGAVHRLF